MTDIFVEFSSTIACEYGLEIAVILGFFKKYHYLSGMMDEKVPSYPSVKLCCSHLTFWSEDKIRELIGKLYTLKLI